MRKLDDSARKLAAGGGGSDVLVTHPRDRADAHRIANGGGQDRVSFGQAGILAQFQAVRDASRKLAASLSDADATVQSMADASPAKWHLAHATWFFEVMVLEPHLLGYRVFDPSFHLLFNSYYETFGARHPRPQRGMLTRPTLATVYAFREHVDLAIENLLRREPSERVRTLIELGCHHEQQHQELLLTDILHLFAQNPLRPAFLDDRTDAGAGGDPTEVGYHSFPGGIVEIGADEKGFAFDCERPRHRVLIEPYCLADRLVTNAEWMEFVADGGYRQPLLWLSEGWAKCVAAEWLAPLYWEERDGEFWTMTLSGMRRVDPASPVVHISFFEADAFARWSDRRLPTEAEWERAAESREADGNFVESGLMRPASASAKQYGLRQMYGDVWEWTGSPFSAYPRFRPAPGAAGEYNGKFMCGQFVLRGGSCATSKSHMRATYRNFFPPDARWQFSGVRLAGDEQDV